MATSLAAQLANIAQTSTRQLDLKAQKQRHAVSFLFDAREASRQSFDEIYALVHPAYADLCALDARFQTFSSTLFHFDSHRQERGNLTYGENEEVGKLVRAFLQLVQSRIQLKPAQRCIEWLIRRWQAHEQGNEIEDLLLAFLPFHATELFPTILSVVGVDRISNNWRWLVPYANALDSVPRHAIVAAITRELGCFRALQEWTIESAKRGYAGHVLLGFWTSVTSQSVANMMDSAQSSRVDVRRQRTDDVLTYTLPTLQEAFSISRKRDSRELYLGACTLATLLATKADLGDRVIDALVDTAALTRPTGTSNEVFLTLALLMEERSEPRLSRSTFNALKLSEDCLGQLKSVNLDHRVYKLTIATVIAALEDGDTSILDCLLSEDGQGNVSNTSLVLHLARLLKGDDDTSRAVRTSLQSLAQTSRQAELIAAALDGDTVDTGTWSRPQLTLPEATTTQQESDVDIDDYVHQNEVDLDSVFSGLPNLPDELLSFLIPSHNQIFLTYAQAFGLCASNKATAAKFLETLAIHGSADPFKTGHSRLLSFLVRVSTEATSSPACRRLASEILSETLSAGGSSSNTELQSLLPYVISALADSDAGVRDSASKLTMKIGELYDCAKQIEKVFAKDSYTSEKGSLYGGESHNIVYLTGQDASTCIRVALLPVLEDCILDADYVLRHLRSTLNGTQGSSHAEGGLKSKLRDSLCNCLLSHATVTAALRAKVAILDILAGVGKAASHARTSILVPHVRYYFDSQELNAGEGHNHPEPDTVARALIQSISHRSKEELELLKGIASGTIGSSFKQSLHAFHQLKHLFAYMKLPSRLALLDFLRDQHGSNQSDSVRADALETLRDLPLSAELLAHLLNSLPTTSDLLGLEPPAKRRRVSSPAEDRKASKTFDGTKLSHDVQDITTVLELVEASKPQDKSAVTTSLFKLLAEVEQLRRRTGSEMVYLQQLLLSVLQSAVSALQPTMHIDRNAIRTDLVVELVRNTNSPQVHTAALRLMTTLAKWDPKTVLHSIMPLFTFMSTSLLQRSDEYTAVVADQAIESIIPALATSLRKYPGIVKANDILRGSSELLLSFVAAWEHVPLHRRLPLIRKLVETLGKDYVLGATVASLTERYNKHSQIRSFVIELLNDFDLTVQINALQQYLDLVEDSLRPKRGPSNTLLGMNDKTVEEVHQSVVDLLEALANMINHHSDLRRRIIKQLTRPGSGAEALKTQYASIMEQAMRISFELTNDAGTQAAAKKVVLAFVDLLPTTQLIEAAKMFVERGGEDVHQSLLQSIEKRTRSFRQEKDSHQVSVFTGPGLDFCLSFLAGASTETGTLHAAISAADTILEKFGKTSHTAALKAAQAVAGVNGLESKHIDLQVISLLTLSTSIEVLGEDFVPLFQRVTSAILRILEDNLQDAEKANPAIISAGFAFFGAVLDHLAYMMGQDILSRTLYLAALMAESDDAESAERYGTLCARQIAPQTLFIATQSLLQEPRELLKKAAGLALLLRTLKQGIARQPKAIIAAHAPVLFQSLFVSFDLRGLSSEASGGDRFSSLDTLINEVGMAVVLKVNDTTFRPFFIRLVEFAGSNAPANEPVVQVLRQQALYSFSLTLFEQLKSIVTSYASFLLPNAAHLMTTLPSAKDNVKQLQLLELVLKAFESSFTEDQDDFWSSPAHFGNIFEPLLSIIARTRLLSTELIQDCVIPAVVELAAAVSSSQDYLKAMNTRILNYAKHEAAAVRLVAVQTQRAVSARLEEDWLVLLPEMLPAISELMEDDDEEVESATIAWVRDVERITGESLDGMLS